MPTLTDQNLKDISDRINDAIEEYSIESLKQEPRTHLGISEIGNACVRQTWYKFRWMKFEEHSGRMLRLFKRGHREEGRFISYLEAIGCKVEQHDENGKQFRVSGVMGHYGGSCDGRAITPWYPDIKMLVEFKTHNTKSYLHLAEHGLHKSKPKHFDQMNGYGFKMNLQYAIYFPENKNDDDIKVTVVRLDLERGRQLEIRAEEIITSNQPPAKISENPSFIDCRWCIFKSICHDDEVPVKNCRSCRLAQPVKNAQWKCNRYNSIIPQEFIKSGCDGWCPL
jgi:hypothetical protein